MSITKWTALTDEGSNTFVDAKKGILWTKNDKGHIECFIINLASEAELNFTSINSLSIAEAKYIGPITLFNWIKKSFIHANKIVNQKIIATSTEIWFYPKSGIIRMAKPINTPIQQNIKIKKKVLIIDDSTALTKLLAHIINSSEHLEVMGICHRPSEADLFLKTNCPDIITLDIHMPEMNGVEYLKTKLRFLKIPVVMISSVSIAEGPLVLEALANGAWTYIQKPSINDLQESSLDINEKLEAISYQKSTDSIEMTQSMVKSGEFFDTKGLIAIGSSTGGTIALQHILTSLPKSIPPIVIVQHIPAVFSKAFADRLNELCPFTIKEAIDQEKIKCDTVYIAPGGKQMQILSKADELYIQITDDEPVNRFKPSVDYLFHSISKCRLPNLVCAILTGMGKDGAQGLLNLKKLGAKTLAQDEASCVVFGMPKEAIAIGAADYIVPLNELANKLVITYNEKKSSKKSA
jgi:two-component system chemotaxis response regulator CheB